ncbi:MAG: SPFH domain-containing protein [Leptolyngbya sp. BL-A-14]
MSSFMVALALAIVGYVAGAIKVIDEGQEGIVERLGQYRRSLSPGLNFVIPIFDTVLVESTREQVLDIAPHPTITRDNVPLVVDAVIFWKIFDIAKAYYGVEDLEVALTNLVVTSLRSEIGQLDLSETVGGRNKINQALLHQLDEVTANWGVKVMRVEVQEISPSKTMLESLELERTAESRRRVAFSDTEAMVEAIRRTALALEGQPNSKVVLQYLLAQHYLDANMTLSKSDNSKIIFIDPKALNKAISELISPKQEDPPFP